MKPKESEIRSPIVEALKTPKGRTSLIEKCNGDERPVTLLFHLFELLDVLPKVQLPITEHYPPVDISETHPEEWEEQKNRHSNNPKAHIDDDGEADHTSEQERLLDPEYEEGDYVFVTTPDGNDQYLTKNAPLFPLKMPLSLHFITPELLDEHFKEFEDLSDLMKKLSRAKAIRRITNRNSTWTDYKSPDDIGFNFRWDDLKKLMPIEGS